MKYVVKNEKKKKDLIKEFLEKRIEENKKLFSEYELNLIKENINTIKKIYILGGINFNKIWHTFWHTKQ